MVFKNVEYEKKQIMIDLQHSEIASKNAHIMNDNLIAHCVAQDIFYTVTGSSLTARQFHEMSIEIKCLQNRVVELEGDNVKLREKIQKDDHDNMVRHFSKLEVDNLNLQLKYQHLEEKVNLANAKASSDVPEFDALFELTKRDEKIQAHTNTIRNLKNIIVRLKDDARKRTQTETLKPPSMDSQIFEMQKVIDHFRLENECY